MKMLRILVALLALSSLSGVASADNATLDTPKSEKGLEVHPLYGGYKFSRINSATESVVCTRRCLLGSIQMSTGATTSFLTVRDSSVADGGGNRILPYRHFTATQTHVATLELERPLRTTLGLTIKLSSVSSGEEVTVGYIEL